MGFPEKLYARFGKEFVTLAAVLVLSAVSASGQFANPATDPAAVARGAKLYGSSCGACHGPDGRGAGTAPDLVRSPIVLHDRLNSLRGTWIATALNTGPAHSFNLDKNELEDLSQYLVQNVNKTLRSGYSDEPTQMLSGDANAGKEYFNGAGGCVRCHSTTGDLAGIGKRYDPPTLQQKFLFPNSGRRGSRTAPPIKKVQVTVTLPSGKSYSGSIVHLDDFNVAFRDDSGTYYSFARTQGVTVRIVDPYAGHVALLDRFTDDDIHNLTTYLETLK